MADNQLIERIPPDMFADDQFAVANKPYIMAYVEYRVNGYHSSVAFRRVFGDENYDNNSHIRISNLEHNSKFKEWFKARLTEISVETLWNTKTSLNELLGLARNVFAKESVRLNAIKELNVLVGITVVDENGKTKAGKTLADFYATNGVASQQPESPDSAAPVKH